MRELVFTLEYEPGMNPVADVLEESLEASVRSLACHVTPESLWRVDRAQGPEETLAALEAAYADSGFFADCLVRDGCGAACETQVLDRSSDTLVVYTYWDRTADCTSVPHVALDTLGRGLLFETYREGRRHRWRIVLSDDAPIHRFFEALGTEVGECAGIEMLRLTDVDPNRSLEGETDGDTALPPEQRAALEAAVDHGYYETPRAIDLSELAARLEVPRSTLSYRLRRAEATLATAAVSGDSAILSPESV